MSLKEEGHILETDFLHSLQFDPFFNWYLNQLKTSQKNSMFRGTYPVLSSVKQNYNNIKDEKMSGLVNKLA